MAKSDVLVVCDAGPLIHLDEVDCLELLADFAKVLVPEAVWREVERHGPQAWDHSGVVLHSWWIDSGRETSFILHGLNHPGDKDGASRVRFRRHPAARVH